MDSDSPHGPRRHGSITRSFKGCWTCRIRHKKCDERNPVCDGCAALRITCYYNQNKPEWMDGGGRQEEMAERLKREIKERSRHRRGDRAAGERVSVARAPAGDQVMAAPEVYNATERSPEASARWSQYGIDCTLTNKDTSESIAITQPDTILLTFYFENLLPFLFPFYSPSLLRGGRAWLLEMMISSLLVRQATLCQSSYYFSLAGGAANYDEVWEKVLQRTRDAFEVLRHSLQIIDGLDIMENLHSAVRIMTSIIQVQRFEIAILGFNNCQAHLNAALALFQQLLDKSSFKAIMSLLGPSSILPAQCVHIPSTGQAAFRFSSTILILDDIIASTVLQEQPKLYKYHRSLLSNIDSSDIDGIDPPINLETVVGCQNWALLQIGEIAVLDTWKHQCKRNRNLNIMELANRATSIKESIEAHLARLENYRVVPKEDSSLLDVFSADYYQQLKTPASQSHLVTRIWAHAALVYLFVVVSGWQPASIDVQHHVGRIIELLTHLSPPALLRTMVWPFCVAGCLAEPAQEALLRGMVKELQPPSVFGTVRKALEIMEDVWRNRDGDNTSRDLATCFRSQGNLGLVLLV